MKYPGLTPRFDEAFSLARELHSDQLRKGTEVPYLAHLMAVAAMVLEDGGDEDQAIAALLHDAVEDQGGYATLEEIRRRFGSHVAGIVEGLSDSFVMPKPPWRARKENYLAHLADQAPVEVLRVSLADKLHNARSLVLDLRKFGPDVWKRFRGGREGTLWYYQRLVGIFQAQCDSPMVGELARVVDDLIRLDHSLR